MSGSLLIIQLPAEVHCGYICLGSPACQRFPWSTSMLDRVSDFGSRSTLGDLGCLPIDLSLHSGSRSWLSRTTLSALDSRRSHRRVVFRYRAPFPITRAAFFFSRPWRVAIGNMGRLDSRALDCSSFYCEQSPLPAEDAHPGLLRVFTAWISSCRCASNGHHCRILRGSAFSRLSYD